jgi:hypothetical protein
MHMMTQPESGEAAPSMQSGNTVSSAAAEPVVDFGTQLKEWVANNNRPDSGSEASVIDWRLAVTGAPPIDRSPWEGSRDIGFRTLLRLDK